MHVKPRNHRLAIGRRIQIHYGLPTICARGFDLTGAVRENHGTLPCADIRATGSELERAEGQAEAQQTLQRIHISNRQKPPSEGCV